MHFANKMDALSQICTSLIDWVGRLHPAWMGFFIRATLLFGLPTVFSYMAFAGGSRSMAGQALCCIVGFLAAASLPVQELRVHNPMLKTWVMGICFSLLLFLPAILPQFVTPRLGAQRKLQTLGYAALLLLFVLNLCRLSR